MRKSKAREKPATSEPPAAVVDATLYPDPPKDGEERVDTFTGHRWRYSAASESWEHVP